MQRPRGMRDELQRELLGAGALGVVCLVACAALLGALQPQLLILRWLPQSLACWALAFELCWQLRSDNRRQVDTPLLPTLGAANRLTLLRGWLVAATAGFLANRSPRRCYWRRRCSTPLPPWRIASMAGWRAAVTA